MTTRCTYCGDSIEGVALAANGETFCTIQCWDACRRAVEEREPSCICGYYLWVHETGLVACKL